MNTTDLLNKISNEDFTEKSVLLVGAGAIARQYAQALCTMAIDDVTVISNSEQKLAEFCNEFKFKGHAGGFEKNLSQISQQDLVIIATPIHMLLDVAKMAINLGQTNILVEKPGSIYSRDLVSFSKEIKNANVRIGYNRLVYPNLLLLKELVKEESGITSCNFTFTEWIERINFTKDRPEVYKRWGVANSLHVISMAVDLIGMPESISCYRDGSFDWHPSGSVFVGSGVSKKGIPFSYHADWSSNGRWGIDVMTKENAYRMMPLEDLFVSKKNSIDWQKLDFQKAYPQVKQGLAEEIAIMLDPQLRKTVDLPTTTQSAELNMLAEKIFGYND